MKRNLKSQLKDLQPGDLIEISWTDASIGKSLGSGVTVDVPVKSWGIFIGILGVKNKHVVIAQNSFHYSDGLYDLDYTAIPLSWTLNITVIAKSHVPPEIANQLVTSFLMGGRRSFSRSRQEKVRNHERHH
ncbi:hypothetical protein DRO69_13460 [Candidatus Bathyarchaeota archaeon]|nr:MAG: hypothetical protein DRO69_13460 [Candidatus Bathyarchaeota archaeon]